MRLAFALVSATLLLSRLCPASAQATPDRSLSAGLELGFEKGTGRSLTLVPLALLQARLGAFAALAEASFAIPGRFLDSASLIISGELPRRGRARFCAEGHARYRSYGSAGDELRLGFLVHSDIGAAKGSRGFFFRSALGYSVLSTRVPALSLSFTDKDPLIRLGFGYRPSPGWELDFALSDYTGRDESLWLKAFFEFGTSWESDQTLFSARAILKYSDIFTLTSYLDGAALRFTALVPLGVDRPHI